MPPQIMKMIGSSIARVNSLKKTFKKSQKVMKKMIKLNMKRFSINKHLNLRSKKISSLRAGVMKSTSKSKTTKMKMTRDNSN